MFVVCLILGSGLPVQFALVNNEDALYCGNRFLANPRVVVAAVVSVKRRIHCQMLFQEQPNKIFK